MADPAIILGTFADLKTVKTRSVVQLIVEVPIERGKQVVEAFGFPQPGAEVPVAVTRVKDATVAEQSKAPKPKRPAERWEEMSPVKQAGIMCNDAAFQRWSCPVDKTFAGTRNRILAHCGIGSRKELNSNPEAAGRWSAMLDQFRADTGRTTEQRG